jgi:DNA-binding NarL/FixJ family response regulator
VTSSRGSVVIIAPPGRRRTSLRVLLEASGRIAQAVEAGDCTAGLSTIRELEPGLIVLDLGEDSRALVQALRQVKAFRPEIPCLVVAHGQEQERRAWAAGARIVLQAGFASEELFQAIAEIPGYGMGQRPQAV